MNLAQKTLLAVTVAVSVAAVVATLMIRFDAGGGQYLWAQLPYVLIVILAIVFRKTVAGATISLIGAVIIGGFGVYVWHTMHLADAVFCAVILVRRRLWCGPVVAVDPLGLDAACTATIIAATTRNWRPSSRCSAPWP